MTSSTQDRPKWRTHETQEFEYSVVVRRVGKQGLIWQRVMAGHDTLIFRGYGLVADNLYIRKQGGGVECISAVTGQPVWERPHTSVVSKGPVVDAQARLLVAYEDGAWQALDLHSGAVLDSGQLDSDSQWGAMRAQARAFFSRINDRDSIYINGMHVKMAQAGAQSTVNGVPMPAMDQNGVIVAAAQEAILQVYATNERMVDQVIQDPSLPVMPEGAFPIPDGWNPDDGILGVAGDKLLIGLTKQLFGKRSLALTSFDLTTQQLAPSFRITPGGR